MVFSILLLLLTVLITLDSIGSKRLRARVIRLAKRFFVEANRPESEKVPTSLRMRFKAAVRRVGRKSWWPIEAKLFATTEPRRMVYYEDRTLGFLLSQKRFWQLEETTVEQSQKILSLFPQITAPDALVQLYQLAVLPWLPGHPLWLSVQWSSTAATEGILQIKEMPVTIVRNIDLAYGGIRSLECTAEAVSIKVNYYDYEEVAGYRVPMRFDLYTKYAEDQYEYRCTIVDLVYNEDFAWW